jgi:hypothetical protein
MTTEFQREQQERRETLENDRKVREQTGTFMSHTHIDDAGGRFAQVNAATVIGATPVPSYPQGPAWSVDPSGVEPPLNYSVNELQPTGEPHEIAASIAAQGSLEASTSFTQGPLPSSASDDAPSPNTPLLSPDVERRDAGLGLSDQQDDNNA